ncbi:sensor histidine kinase [Bradyrhizobium sp. CCBAU 11357]|uniref:sensor histidine kinase n=1 Tax=Bradyrhizobium sp. CCBAU 11357 TaxID=1630808 RepID=UPI002FE2A9FD
MRLISAVRRVRQQRHSGWIISLAALCACLMLRIAIQDYSDSLAAGALMPAVMIAALFGGIAEGIVTFALASFILFFFFIPPYLTFEIERPRDVVGLSLFIATGLIYKLADEARLMQQRTSVLFAELQHRVANNLAFLTAVLDQKARQFDKNGPVGCVLAAVKDRLMAMSRSHRRLYDPQRVNEPIGQYLAELCSEQISASGLPVTHSIECDPIILDLGQLVPVALIVSELITNCLKHAFQDRTDGHITLRFHRCGQEAELAISDNGLGITVSPKGTGLGQKIVAGLAAQLNADLRFESGTGTTAVLRFPVRVA